MTSSTDARPVTRNPDTSYVVASFYPLHNHTCPPPSTTVGGCIVARMMRGKEISVRWTISYSNLPPITFLCRACRLGAIVSRCREPSIRCVHGPWTSPTTTQAIAAQRLGVMVETCRFCGNTFRPLFDWEWKRPETITTTEPLTVCGKRCRERSRLLLSDH